MIVRFKLESNNLKIMILMVLLRAVMIHDDSLVITILTLLIISLKPQ